MYIGDARILLHINEIFTMINLNREFSFLTFAQCQYLGVCQEMTQT